MQNKSFAKHRLAHAVSIAVGVSLTCSVTAQDEVTDEEMIEEVVVTGIRSSLKRAMDTKRDSRGVVDAITAEDIGDFPDTNLAEALQRITGVAIERQRGEGTTVTVRGFGADFNLVTLNGRQMPTHSGLGRAFDFQDIASESVSGVEAAQSRARFIAAYAARDDALSAALRSHRPLYRRESMPLHPLHRAVLSVPVYRRSSAKFCR